MVLLSLLGAAFIEVRSANRPVRLFRVQRVIESARRRLGCSPAFLLPVQRSAGARSEASWMDACED